MFRDARNIVVNGGSFTSIDNGTNVEPVSTILWQHVASGAIFDSAERYPPGKCHPGTRQSVIEQIMEWINDPNPTRPFLWLHGPAGSGKSAIAHSVCELLRQSHPQLYGGSFFFMKGHPDRGRGIKLFTTLSYQLAIQFPAIRAEVNEALSRDPSLPTKSMDLQLLLLIVKPLLGCGAFYGAHTPTIIIDGLDECDEDNGMDTQRNIISLLSNSIVQHRVPIRVLVACRPEYWIRDAFDNPPLTDLTFFLSLRDDEDTDNDIRAYLTNEFDNIRIKHKRTMGSVTLPWPSTKIIDRFVYEASGQYIYASTVLKFVGNSSKFVNPQEQLRIITSPGPRRASAFSELDRLYSTIISAYPRRRVMKDVLAGLLANANSTTIQIVFDIDPTEFQLALEALNSLIDTSAPNTLSESELLLEPIFGSLSHGEAQYTFSHLTFREFLADQTRSGVFYVDVGNVQEKITRTFFSVIHRNLDCNYKTEPHSLSKLDLTVYRRMMSGMIFNAAPYCEVGVLLQLIKSMTTRLQLLDPNGHMNHPACFIQDMEWIESMLSETEDHYKSVIHGLDPRRGAKRASDSGGHKLLRAISGLRETASLARKQGIRLLSLCQGYRITPSLMYMNVFSAGYGAPIRKIFTIPGTTVDDTLSSLQQHRHIIKLYELEDQHWFMYLVNLNINSPDSIDEGWLSRTEWTSQRTSLAYQCLLSLTNNKDNDWEQSIDGNVDMRYTLIGEFLDNGDLSDIRTSEYFKHPHNLALLSLMVDPMAWNNLLILRPDSWTELSSVIRPALSWFDRQLTNPQTLSLLDDYDKDVSPKMMLNMNALSRAVSTVGVQDDYHGVTSFNR